MNTNNKILNEVVDINGTKIIMENGNTRVVYNDDINNGGYMPVDEAFEIIEEVIRMVYASKGLHYIKNSYK